MVLHITPADILLIEHIFPHPFGARKNGTQHAKCPCVYYNVKPSNKIFLLNSKNCILGDSGTDNQWPGRGKTLSGQEKKWLKKQNTHFDFFLASTIFPGSSRMVQLQLEVKLFQSLYFLCSKLGEGPHPSNWKAHVRQAVTSVTKI